MAFLRHRDLFPDAPAPKPADPESGVHRTAKKRASKAPSKAPSKKKNKKTDASRIPILNVSPRQVRFSVEDARARWLAPFIDGVMPLDDVLAASALGPDDARAGMEILVAAGLVTLL